MDVLLGISAFGLSSYLPKCVQPPQTKPVEAPPLTIRIAASLSFLLLALSIIDSVPTSWMLLLNEQWIPVAYRIVLLLVVTSVLIVFPAILGARLVAGSSTSRIPSSDEMSMRKSATTTISSPMGSSPQSRCRRPTWARWFCWNLGSLLSTLVVFFCQNLVLRPLNRILGTRLTGNASSILPTTTTSSPASNGGGTVFRFPTVTASILHLRLIPMLGSIAAVAVTITVMSTVSPWFVRTTSTIEHHSFRTMPVLSITVSWLCSVGIFLSSVVNGFGSVSLPYSCLAGLYLEPISDEAVNRAQQELGTARQSIANRQNELAQINGGVSPSSLSSTMRESPTSGGSEKRKPSPLSSPWSFSSSNISEEHRQTTRRKQLTQEINFLTTLADELEQEIYDMLQSKEMAAQARTRWGKIRSWVGVFFSVVLVIRLIGAAWFVWRHDHPSEKGSRTTGSDIVTMTVLFLIGHDYVNQQQYNTLSQVISLVLTAYLSFSQVRTFIRAIDAVYRRLQQCWKPCYSNDHHIDDSSLRFMSLHNGLRSSAYAPLVASLMCCYFLACVVLTKLLVPSTYRRALALALESTSTHPSAVASEEGSDEEQLLRFFLRIRSYAVNSVFLATALVSTLCLGMMLGLQRHQSMRHRSSVPVVLLESP